MNYARTALLLAAMTGLFLAVGFLIGGQSGMMIALVIALATNLFAYWNADRMVLRMHGALEVDAASAPQLHAIVAGLAQRAQLPMPRIYLMQNDQPNAFATGRNPQNAAVAVTTGLLQRLDEQQVTGVIAHELAHVLNRDTLTMTVTATLAGAIGMLGTMAMFGLYSRDDRNNPLGAIAGLLAMIVAPVAASLVQLAISRSREFEADRVGAAICGEPRWLASALAKIHNASLRIDNPTADAAPATAHLFIINPLHARAMEGLFSTHPSTEERIRRLDELALRFERQAPAGRRGPWG